MQHLTSIRRTAPPMYASGGLLLFLLTLPALSLARDTGWRWHTDTALSAEYTSNVFNLDRSAKGRVKHPSSADRSSGRVRDMDSVDDFFLSSRLEFTGKTRSPLGGKFSIAPRVTYRQHAENPDKSYPEFGLKLRQSLAERASLELELEYKLNAFKKNYLYDTTVTGSVTPAQRVYARGEYDQLDVELKYSQRLWSRKKRSRSLLPGISSASGEVTLGFRRRSFDRFANRDLDILSAGLSLAADLGKRADIKLSYTFANVEAPGNREILVLDEPSIGTDLNGDLDSLDDDIRTLQRVDRSRDDHSLGLKLKIKLARRLRGWVSYRFTLLNYQSNALFDVAHTDREDREHLFRLGTKWKFSKHWAAFIEGKLNRRRVNKDSALVADEDGSKRRASVRLLITREF